MRTYEYVGDELELFARASKWKSYLRREMSSFIGSNVLEVGSGIGGTTQALCTGKQQRWICLEADSQLGNQLRESIEAGTLPECCQVRIGTTVDLIGEMTFDTVLYVDVLEHIEDDAAELERATDLLAAGGHLIVLSPAHQWLYSRFDAAIGHHRRYDKKHYEAISPGFLRCRRLAYLDSVGLFSSLANRLFLKSSMPTRRQIATWDGWLVPISRLLDPMLFYAFGKSILGVWEKPEGG